jgi:NitT/TauT family transport system ATP-binding protein
VYELYVLHENERADNARFRGSRRGYAQTRAELEDLIRDLWQKLKVTVLFVTHDIDEAVYLGQRVLILSSSPTVVQEQLVIDLPAERDQLHTRADARFASLRTHVYEQIQAAKAARSLETVSFDV